MDLEDPRSFELFLEVYGALPRAGPGSTADTLRALDLVSTDKVRSVLDLGCGPGSQTLVLAEALPKASVLALDLVPQLVEEARRRVEQSGLEDRVRVEVGDMMAVEVPKASQDLIWCEGAIYFAGITKALKAWSSLLTESGTVVFTEPVWIDPSPPAELVAWWRKEYPAITDDEGVRAEVAAAGYDVLGSFPLPAASWWEEYYGPMEKKIPEFLAAHPKDSIARQIAEEATGEIEMFRRNSDSYSYSFFAVRPQHPRFETLRVGQAKVPNS
jgi:trans-aconitate methyltransferase